MSADVVGFGSSPGSIDVNGVELFVRSIGDGPDVVVLHGGPGAHHDYLLPQYDALATGRRLVYYDQRGGGRSPVARDVPVGWQEHVADLDALLEKRRLDHTTLLGYSWGGLLALLYTVHHPGRVARLALVAPAPATASGRAEFERRFQERMRDPWIEEQRRGLQRSDLRERDPDAYRRRTFELSVAAYFKDRGRARDLTPFRVTARTQQAVWQSLGDYDLSEQIAELSIPSIVLHGRYDPVPLATARQTADLLKAPLEILENSGHAPHVEDFARFVAVLDGFLPKAS